MTPPPGYYRGVGDPDEDEPTRPGGKRPPMSEEYALAQLRHLYQLMVQGQLRTQAQIGAHARGLLGSVIEALETAHAARAVHREQDAV